jgi:hypothetical protein
MQKASVGAVAFGLTASVLLIGAAALAQTNGYAKIAAQFQIIGKDAVDPPPGQTKDRVALFLTGDGAKQIYQSMPTRETKAGQCEEGLKLKSSGGLICASHSNGTYSCSVAILLKSGETRPSGGC